MMLRYCSGDSDNVAQFAYSMSNRSSYNILEDYITRESIFNGRSIWVYTAIMPSMQKRCVTIGEKSKPDFTPDGLLSWNSPNGKTIFLDPITGKPEVVE